MTEKEKYYVEMSGPSYINIRRYGPYNDIEDAKDAARNILAKEVKLDNICDVTVSGKIDSEVFRLKLPSELTFSTLTDAQEVAGKIALFIWTLLEYRSVDTCKFHDEYFSIERDFEEIELKKIHYSYNRTQDVSSE